MANDTVDPPMQGPGVFLVVVASAAVLLLTSFMLIDFAFGPSEAAKAKALHDTPAHAAAPATKPG